MMARVALAALLACALTGAALAQPAETQRFGIPGRGNLVLNVPQGWRAVDQGLADPPSLILRMRPASGDAFYLQITSVLVPPERLASLGDEGIKSRVQESAKRMLPRALESEAVLTELRGKEAAGYYFALTDRASPNSGTDYKHIVQGTIRTAEVITVFTFLHREPGPAEKELALRMLADATFAKGPATAEAPRPDVLQVATLETGYELSVPVSKLVMTIPKGKLMRGPGSGGNHPRYFYFLDGTLNVSGWFEPADKFRGMAGFWEGETRGWKQNGLPEPSAVAFARLGNWDAVFYDMALPGASGASNTHIRAHWVQGGTWIDIHLSLTAPKAAAETRAMLQSFLETIQVKEKP